MKTEKQELAEKSLYALYLELPDSIAESHHKIINDAFEEIRNKNRELIEGINWVREEYVKCVNDSDAITEKLQELMNKQA